VGKHSDPRRGPDIARRARPVGVAAPKNSSHSLQMILDRGTLGFWPWLGQLITLAGLAVGAWMLVREVGEAVATWLSTAAAAAAFSGSSVPPLLAMGSSALVGAATGITAHRRLTQRLAATAHEPDETASDAGGVPGESPAA
jgi:hypothetical protein